MATTTTVRDEPSMEEILASIRKIISEQETEPARGAPPRQPVPEPQSTAPLAEVLELTRVLNDDGTITDLSAMGQDMLADDFDSMVAEAVAAADDVTPSALSPAEADLAAALEDVAADLADFSDAVPAFDPALTDFDSPTAEDSAVITEDDDFGSFAIDAPGMPTTDAESLAGIDAEAMIGTAAAAQMPSAVAALAPAAAISASPPPAPASTASGAFTPMPATASSASAATPPAAAMSTAGSVASILSSEAVDRSLAALSELRTAVQAASQPPTGPSVTLEDLTRELLRPMLKAWLDANLPPLVERVVKEEIRRITSAGTGEQG